MGKINGIGKELYALIFTDHNNHIELWFANDATYLYDLVKADCIENNEVKDESEFDDLWQITIIPKFVMTKSQVENSFFKVENKSHLYFSLWFDEDEDPDPLTFNTNSLADIRNFLVWKYIDLKTKGEISISGTNYENYNFSEVDWEKYNLSLREIYTTVDRIHIKYSDAIYSDYKLLQRYVMEDNPKHFFYTIETDLIDFCKCELFISETAFDNDSFTVELNTVKHLFGKRPWISDSRI